MLYALFFCGRIKSGESILIHAGSGGVGQAAINVCSHLKCRIFTTVGTPQKRRFIRENFPHVSADEAQARRGGASYLRALAEIAHPTYCTYVRTYVVRVHLHVPAYEYTYGYKYTNTTSTIFYHTAILVDTCTST